MEDETVYRQGRTVELIDYLSVIWKWKYFIIGITLLFIVGAFVSSLVMKKVYRVSIIIEPGIMDIIEGGLKGGKLLYLDSTENLASKIENKAFNQEIIKDLNLDAKKDRFKFYVTKPPKVAGELITNALQVYIESSDTPKGKTILHSLIKILKGRYGEISNKRENQVTIGINIRKSLLKYNLGRIEKLRTEIEKAQEYLKIFIKKREMMANNQKDINPSNFLLYSHTLQQYISSIGMLEKELSVAVKIAKDLQKEIEGLEVKKNIIKELNVVQKPQSSIFPIRPNKSIYITVGAFAGLFLSLLSIFFIEYITKARKA